MPIEPNKIIYSMVGVGKDDDKFSGVPGETRIAARYTLGCVMTPLNN
jgi:hypothetical protein